NATSKERSSIQCAGCDCCHPKRRKWVRTGISGMICDFDVYQGRVNGIRAKSELGLSGDVVMKLASTLPEGQNYKIYADNYFTCVPLVVKLLDHRIHYVGTARQVRLPNYNLEEEKSLKKKGEEALTSEWRPTKTSVLSNGRQQRGEHNSSENTKERMTIFRQREPSSDSDIKEPKRPSSGDGSPPNGAPSKRSQPPLDVRKDLVAHFPGMTKRGRCRNCSKGYTNTQWTKCDVPLCFSDDRNCFLDYHIHIQ
ncbi:hypothetical protein F7725_007487, partial [Dissostichus mawsoni]